MRLTIGRRLGLGFFAVTAASGCAAGAGIFGLLLTSQRVDHLAEMATDSRISSEVTKKVYSAEVALERFMVEGSPSDMETFRENAASFQKYQLEADAALQNPERRALLAVAMEATDPFIESAEQLYKIKLDSRDVKRSARCLARVAIRSLRAGKPSSIRLRATPRA